MTIETVPTCPHGVLKNMKCVVEKEPECSYGYAKDPVSKECIHTEGPQCPCGQKFTGQHCALADGDCMEFEYCPNIPGSVDTSHVAAGLGQKSFPGAF